MKIFRLRGVLIGLCLLAKASFAAERPNIILLIGDDHGWDETGYDGHPYLKTLVLGGRQRRIVTPAPPRARAAAPVRFYVSIET